MPGIFTISTKTQLFIASILLSLILIAGCVLPVPSSNNTAAQDTIRSTRVLNATNGSYSVNATVPVVTGTLMVYTLEKPSYSKEWVSSLAEKLRMSGDVREVEGSFLANISDEKKFYFWVEKDVKRILYIQKGGFSSGNMTEAEAVAFAQEFLKSVDLMPDATEPRVAYNTAETFSRSSGQASQSLKEAVVVFNRRINGLPAWGSSSMITVGPNGNMDGGSVAGAMMSQRKYCWSFHILA